MYSSHELNKMEAGQAHNPLSSHLWRVALRHQTAEEQKADRTIVDNRCCYQEGWQRTPRWDPVHNVNPRLARQCLMLCTRRVGSRLPKHCSRPGRKLEDWCSSVKSTKEVCAIVAKLSSAEGYSSRDRKVSINTLARMKRTYSQHASHRI
jgi:hypothetical protein